MPGDLSRSVRPRIHRSTFFKWVSGVSWLLGVSGTQVNSWSNATLTAYVFPLLGGYRRSQAEIHKKNYASIEFSGSDEKDLVAQAAESLQVQNEIEEADTLNFADFLDAYNAS